MKLRIILFVVGFVLFTINITGSLSPYDTPPPDGWTGPDGWTQYPETPGVPGGNYYMPMQYNTGHDYSWVVWLIVFAGIVFFIILVIYAWSTSKKKVIE